MATVCGVAGSGALAAMASSGMAKTPKPAGPVPSRAALLEAALQHLSRFGVTEAGLARVLQRRVDRWARRAADEDIDVAEARSAGMRAAQEVAHALAQAGAVDDASFAKARAARLLRSGRSRRATAAHLAAKGVASDVAGQVLPADEVQAAVALTRRRRLGAFRPAAEEGVEADREQVARELAVLGRAGFPREVAERAVRMEREEAERMLLALKRL